MLLVLVSFQLFQAWYSRYWHA